MAIELANNASSIHGLKVHGSQWVQQGLTVVAELTSWTSERVPCLMLLADRQKLAFFGLIQCLLRFEQLRTLIGRFLNLSFRLYVEKPGVRHHNTRKSHIAFNAAVDLSGSRWTIDLSDALSHPNC